MIGDLPPMGRDLHEARWQAVQRDLRDARLDALVVSALPSVRWLTGYDPALAVSADRAWIVVLPMGGAPVAVMPSVVAPDLAAAHLGGIETWDAPAAGDETGPPAILEAVLAGLSTRHGRVGIETGAGLRPTMPSHWARTLSRRAEIVEAGGLILRHRRVKAAAEVARIEAAARAACAGFDALMAAPLPGARTEREVAAELTAHVLREGAGEVGYLAVASGPGGYDSATRRAGDRALREGDVLTADIGARAEGHWSDFNRNIAIGAAPTPARDAHRRLYRALTAGIAAIRPGARARDVHQAMARALGEHAPEGGRMGHGVGLELTEGPSLRPDDASVLTPGMVLAVEPSLTFARGDGTPALMVREELVVVEGHGARLLSAPAPEDLPVWTAA